MSTISPERNVDSDQNARKQHVMATLARHPFRPAWWLRNNHAQTVWARYGQKHALPPMRLERWDTPDDDFIRVHRFEGAPAMPTALLLHGLEGCVESTYIVKLVNLLAEKEWNVLAIEHRSCGGEMNRARRMYHSGETSDVAFVVEKLTAEQPGIHLYIAGYSLGGNVTAKYLGEMGEDVPASVKAGAVISAPYELLKSGPYIDSGIRRFYVKHFLKMLVPKAIEKDRLHPGILDIERIKQATTFREFDTYATAALHGFRDAEDYYEKVACGQFLHAIRVPTMLLSAADDPFNPGDTLPHAVAEASPWLHPQFTKRGGHVGFVSGPSPWRPVFWAEEQIVRFFEAYRAIHAEGGTG